MKHVDKSAFFLSAEQLGLKPYQRDALVEVHQRMVNGLINEVNFDYSDWPVVGHSGVDCGCLGYHADRVVGRAWADRCGQRLCERDENHALLRLFYCGHIPLARPPTLAESRTALETYLTTSVTEWRAL